MPRPLLIAVQFLTCLPVRLNPAPQAEEIGRSVLWYPLVGLLLGAMLWGLDALLGAVAPLLRAAMLLAAWVLASGALHLDGLGDSADAWVGGHGDRARMLAIMKDPYAGPMAVTAIMLLLLLKFAALDTLLESRSGAGRGELLLLAPLLGRCAMPLLFATTPYVRAQGLGAPIAAHLPRRGAFAVVVLALLGVCLCCQAAGLLAAAGFMLSFALLRQAMIRRLGGTSGDTAGAMVELIELAVLLIAATSGNLSAWPRW
jgi:adenosylcobinamide-GDP ribazoletransferase